MLTDEGKGVFLKLDLYKDPLQKKTILKLCLDFLSLKLKKLKSESVEMVFDCKYLPLRVLYWKLV